MEIVAFPPSLLPSAAAQMAGAVRALQARVPALPPTLCDPVDVAALQVGVLREANALAAVDGDRLLGFLGWWVVDDFRAAGRRAAYSPVHGHAAEAARAVEIYRALYAQASRRWTAEGCEVHYLTLLAGQPEVERGWFENGFGMLVRDGIRPITPLAAPPVPGVRVRPAVPSDAPALALLDVEHCAHYAAPPVFMAPREPATQEQFAEIVTARPDSIWVAEDGDGPQAFLRVESHAEGGVELVRSPETVAVTGAFTRPAWRGRGMATALLDAALAHVATRGFTRMSVDYETVNPPALAFWPRHFATVATSVMRIPERVAVRRW